MGRAVVLVGLAGLEPATFRPPDGRATRLRHSPNCGRYINLEYKGKSKARNLGIRLYEIIIHLAQLRLIALHKGRALVGCHPQHP